jgi:hypothetical protein
MASIHNDHELKLALEGLTSVQQRVVGSQFVSSVLGLSDDPLVKRAVDVAANEDAADAECEEAYRSAKAVAVKTYTDCGKDTDWMSQAAHFVAAAAASCLNAASSQGADNPAWKAAIQARMARNCEMIERQDGGTHDEADIQYDIVERFTS